MIGCLQSRGGSQQRALAGAIGAEQAHDLAARHGERYLVQCHELPVAAAKLHHVHHRSSSMRAQRGTRRAEWSTAVSNTIQPSSGIITLAAIEIDSVRVSSRCAAAVSAPSVMP